MIKINIVTWNDEGVRTAIFVDGVKRTEEDEWLDTDLVVPVFEDLGAEVVRESLMDAYDFEGDNYDYFDEVDKVFSFDLYSDIPRTLFPDGAEVVES